MKVSIEFSLAEARALSFAAGNSIKHPDVMKALFQNGSKREAAYRAYGKLFDAIVAANDTSKQARKLGAG